MHDLNTINRLNAEAHGDAITYWRRNGKHVVTVHEGLALVTATPHDTHDEAVAASVALVEVNTGRTVTLLAPTRAANPVAITRDQSEDTGASFATVADYLRHVTPPAAATALHI